MAEAEGQEVNKKRNKNPNPRPPGANGKPVLSPYVVTVQMEHFVNVRATDIEDAGRRAVEELQRRFYVGRGLTQVTEVEAHDG